MNLPTPYFEDREHGITLYCRDCRDIFSAVPDCFTVDMVLTSPPYGELRDYDGYDWDFDSVSRGICKVLSPGGVCVWVVGDQTINGSESCVSFRQALGFRELGLRLHDTMIYQSAKPPLTHNRYEQEFEYMFVLSKGNPRTFNPILVKTIFSGDKKRFNYGKATAAKKEGGDAMRWRDETLTVGEKKIKGNVWKYATGLNGSTRDVGAFEHPAIFPELLAADHIRSWTNPGDVVLDPMCGSGTTLKMAKQLGRKAIGIEISEKYCAIAVDRLRQMELFTNQDKS